MEYLTGGYSVCCLKYDIIEEGALFLEPLIGVMDGGGSGVGRIRSGEWGSSEGHAQ